VNRAAERKSRGRERSVWNGSGEPLSAAYSVSAMISGTESGAGRSSRPGRRGTPFPAEMTSGAINSSGVSVRKAIELRRTASRGA